MDIDVNIYEAVQQAFYVYDNMDAGDENRTAEGDVEGSHGPRYLEGGQDGRTTAVDEDENIPNPHSSAQVILEDSATTPLFADSQLSCMSAIVLLPNCLQMHGASNTLINELFMFLSRSILPTISFLAISEYSASKMLRHLGLAYELIHSCVDGCILFQGIRSELLDEYTKCWKPRSNELESLWFR
jgi:hypothetical protein